MFTPWGASQQTETIAPGIVEVWTASHGGIHLEPEQNAQVHQAWRQDNGWYEEDCEWTKVALTFPALFADRTGADASARCWFPDEYELVTGNTVTPEESLVRQGRLFDAAHHDDWVVVAAIGSDTDRGMVVCTATLGGRGRMETWNDSKKFLVTKERYDLRGNESHVIDPSIDTEIEAS